MQTHCYKGLARPVLEYASPIWDPHQQYLINTLEAVQRRTARRITRDFSPTTSATALVSSLQLQPLRARRQVDKAALLYKVVTGQVDWKPPEGLLTPTARSTRGQQDKFLVPHSRTDAHLHSHLPITPFYPCFNPLSPGCPTLDF